MKKFTICFLIATMFITTVAFKYNPTNSIKINWQTVDEVSTLWQKNKKPIIIDVYTDWCHYCKVMDNTTYSNDSIAKYINDHFYSVRINAESKAALNWMGKTYNYISKYKVNELAIDLTKGNLVYPTTIIIPANGEAQPIGGAISVQEMEMILKYFGEKKFGEIEWEKFSKGFKASW